MGHAAVVLRGIELGADPSAATALGLAVDEGGRALVGGVTLAFTGRGGGIRALDLDGDVGTGVLPTADVPSAVLQRPHPLGAVAVDHVVVLTGDVAATVDALGVAPRRTEVARGRRYAYLLVGTSLLEVVGPLEPDERPPRPWGLALAVADLDAAVAGLADACGEVRPAVQPGRRIATVRHEAIDLDVPTVLLSPRPSRPV